MIKSLFSRLTIAQKFVALIMLISTVSIIFATAMFTMNEYYSAERQLRERVTLLGEVVAENITAAVAFDDKDATGELINILNADMSIRFARVTDITGEVMASYGDQSFEHIDIGTLYGNYVVIERELYLDRQRVGRLLLVGDKASFYSQIEIYLAVAVFVLIGSVMFSLALSFWLQKQLSGPIVHLSNVAREVKDLGNYSLRARVRENDEIGDLATVFNGMLEQIESRDQMLEAEVKKRTQELEDLNHKLAAQAFYDGLTGLPNRTLFEDRLKKAMAHQERRGGKVALLFIDLDGFKQINDTMGHSAGDELLIKVSERLAVECRDMDTVARFGGDEFIMLMVLEENEEVVTIAERIVKQFNRPFLINGEIRKATLSMGVAVYGQHGNDFDTLKAYADEAMYDAKRNGKNGYVICTAESVVER